MFIVLLKFAKRESAGPFMSAHNVWVAQGVADGVFLLVGSLQPKLGGAILSHGESREALEARIARDPFVEQGVVRVEILEISAHRADPRLEFLLG